MIRLMFILGLALAGAAAALAGGEDKAEAIRAALAAGQPLVLAVAEELPAPDAANEGYADWAAYLNDFAAGHGGFTVLALDGKEAAALLAAPPALDGGFATIFVRSPQSAVIYDGAILEEFVYDAGADYLQAPADGRYDPRLFEPFAFRLK